MYSKLPQQKTQLVAVGGFGQLSYIYLILAHILIKVKLPLSAHLVSQLKITKQKLPEGSFWVKGSEPALQRCRSLQYFHYSIH